MNHTELLKKYQDKLDEAVLKLMDDVGIKT